MSFLAFSPLPAVAFLAAIAVLIWLLYLIRPSRLRVAVASTLLWRRVLGEARPRSNRWRWLRSLLLALAIGLSLAFALTRPELRVLGASHQRIVVILDNSSSMAARTRDGSTRWQHALAGARQLVLGAGAGMEVLVLDTAGRAPLAGFLPREQAMEQMSRIELSPEASARVPPRPVGATIAGAYLFTDGVGVGEVPSGIAVRSVFEPAENVALTGFEARPVPGDPTRYEAFLQVYNAGATQKQVKLEIVGADGFRVGRQLQIAGGATANQTLDVSRFEQGPLRAQVQAQGDALELDDTAYCIVSPHRTRRVLLVTSGDGFLENSLRALPGVVLSVRSPAEVPALPAFDAYVFDRYAPREPPAAGALLFRPPEVAWLGATWRPASQSVVTGWEESHALSAGVAWRDLRLERAQLGEPNGSTEVVMARLAGNRSAAGALVLAGRARARWVAVGFAMQDSNFHLQPGFPVFLGTALDWLTDSPSVASQNLGRIEVPIADAQIHDSSGRPISATATARGTLFEASRPGIYFARGAREQLVVVANALDPRAAQINDRRIPADAARPQSAGPPRLSWPEPWVWLLAFAFILLTAEWAGFSRRVTE